MSHVFVSYSRKDSKTVDQIVARLTAEGLEVWIDREEIKAGELWRTQIVEAIDTCDAFILMLSCNSVVSDNVRKEIDLAQDSGRNIFVMKFNEAKLPAEIRYQLAGLQFIDLQLLGFDKAVSGLSNTLKEQLKPAGKQLVRQAELVIKGIDPNAFGSEKRKQLIEFISKLARTPQSSLQVVAVVAGSVHIFIDMPALTAFELKTRALNRDHHFKRFGIKSLKLVGDKKYINISLGILTTTATIGALKLLWLSMPSLFPSIVGVTAGKLIVITSALVVTTAVSMTVSNTVIPMLNPTPTLISTAIPTQTPTPQNPLVIRDTLCWNGPDPSYEVVSSIKAGMRVELVGRANIESWWVVSNPRYHTPCWMRESDLQIDPDNFSSLPIFTPPPPMGNLHRNPDNRVTPTPFNWLPINPCGIPGFCKTPTP